MATHENNPGTDIRIKHKRIRPSKDQPRKFFDQAALQELAASISEVGQEVPITIYEVNDDPDHDFEIIDGERRWRACGILGFEEIRAYIDEIKDPRDHFIKSVVSNFGRADHTPMEIAEAVKRIQEAGKTVQQISRIFAKSLSWVYQYASLLRLHEEVQDMLHPMVPDTKKLAFSIAILLTNFPHEIQRELAREIVKNNMSMNRARFLIRKFEKEANLKPEEGRRIHNRKPSKDFAILNRFLSSLKESTAFFLDMNADVFDNMFRMRPDEDRARTQKAIEAAIEELSQMLDVVKGM
ncbi:MAG: hypothetical protein A2586_01140 [Candidatus Harrisonbacteria bacterium RIFOXYD1_FULL_40_9]|uniref:ParB-like N-terminal domain-containing protein n=1 Tax=Candidatus Harrisonbacteria bacterium RIFOXYD1_FULL_40_9 TaxID=1798412 RepID=A0A1G1ZWV2_9BACT|nr:MAG: hypothetical protein A2586_01140 [Candidatus Harrisonbacteria bacterium RIFOXYD1_FULL_40_9]